MATARISECLGANAVYDPQLLPDWQFASASSEVGEGVFVFRVIRDRAGKERESIVLRKLAQCLVWVAALSMVSACSMTDTQRKYMVTGAVVGAGLGGGLGGYYGLGARAGEAARNAVHFHRGPRPGTLHDAVSLLAHQRLCARVDAALHLIAIAGWRIFARDPLGGP